MGRLLPPVIIKLKEARVIAVLVANNFGVRSVSGSRPHCHRQAGNGYYLLFQLEQKSHQQSSSGGVTNNPLCPKMPQASMGKKAASAESATGGKQDR